MNTSTMHDIYNPPPAPAAWAPPQAAPFAWSAADLACPALLVGLLLIASAWAWQTEPIMAGLTLLGGSLVILESWSTAMAYLQRRPSAGLTARGSIFLAALLPWVVGLGLAAALMLGLFRVIDRAG